MRFLLAVFFCRALYFAGGIFHRGSAKPGEWALKLCPDALARLKFDGKVICVTGTNGKTTTANLIAHILRESGHTAINNAKGSNMLGGVATLLLNRCTLGRRVKADYVVLEVDERYMRLLVRSVHPDYFLVNNLLRDQIARNCCPEIVFDKMKPAIVPGTTLILNANDPISQRLAEGTDNPVVLFGMDRTSRSTEVCLSGTDDGKVCPKCFHPLEYEYRHYNHIGKFYCPNCGFSTPEADFFGTDFDFDDFSYTLRGVRVKATYGATYYLFNTVAAVATAAAAGVPFEDAVRAVGTFTVNATRYQEFSVRGRRAQLILTKQNPASIDQSVDYVVQQRGERTAILFAGNMLHSHNKDALYMYDVGYERMAGAVDHIICAGDRCYDLAVRLKLAGVDMGRVRIADRLEKIPAAVDATAGDVYILSAYALENETKFLEVLKSL